MNLLPFLRKIKSPAWAVFGLVLALSWPAYSYLVKGEDVRLRTDNYGPNLTDEDNLQDAIETLSNTAGGSGEINTASNTGSAGVGVFKQKTGVDLELYKLNPSDSFVKIQLNGTDKIDFSVNWSALNDNIYSAGINWTDVIAQEPLGDGICLQDGTNCPASGVGDMSKATYDANTNNIVDWAENINAGGINWTDYFNIPAGGVNWTDVYVPDTSVNWSIQVPLNEVDPTVDTSAEIQTIIGAGVYEPAGVAAADISDASANGRSLITAANYAAMRGLLDLGNNIYYASEYADSGAGTEASPWTGWTDVFTAALAGENGGAVIIDSGVFAISSTLALDLATNSQHLTIKGNRDSKIKCTMSDGSDCITITGTDSDDSNTLGNDGLMIDGLWMVGNASAGDCMVISYASDIALNNIYMQACGDDGLELVDLFEGPVFNNIFIKDADVFGLHITGATNGTHDASFTNLQVEGSGDDNVHIDGVYTQLVFNGGQVEDCGGSNFYVGNSTFSEDYGSGTVTIQGFTIDGCTNKMAVEAVLTGDHLIFSGNHIFSQHVVVDLGGQSSVVVDGNDFDWTLGGGNNSNWTVDIGNASSVYSGPAIISNNSIWRQKGTTVTDYGGIRCRNVDHCVIDGNKIGHAEFAGAIYLEGDYGQIIGNEVYESELEGIQVNDSDRISISNNIIINSGNTAASSAIEIIGNSSHVSLVGNVAYDTAAGASRTQNYGLEVGATANDFYSAYGNVFVNNKLGEVTGWSMTNRSPIAFLAGNTGDTNARLDISGYTSFTPPSGTAFPGTPNDGDLFIITDDSASGACDSAAGSALTMCRYNGSSWVAVGDGGAGGGTECSSSSCDLNINTTLNSQDICLQDGTNCPVSGGGDAVTVNSTGADTTANLLDGGIKWTLVDGGAGGPDDITGTINYGTAFPGSPATGDVFVVTDDSAAGACDSSGGSALSLCRYNGSGWDAVGDGGGSAAVIMNETLSIQSAKLPATNPARIDAGNAQWRLLFNDTTAQDARWTGINTEDYTGGTLYADIYFSMASGEANEVQFRGYVMAYTAGTDSADIDTDSFDTANEGSATTVAATAGRLYKQTITLTNNDGLAAGDWMAFKLDRDATDATNDDAAGDAEVREIVIHE